jgi:hypothetical protein
VIESEKEGFEKESFCIVVHLEVLEVPANYFSVSIVISIHCATIIVLIAIF